MLTIGVRIEENIENTGSFLVLPNLRRAVTTYKTRGTKASGDGDTRQAQELLRIIVDLWGGKIC